MSLLHDLLGPAAGEAYAEAAAGRAARGRGRRTGVLTVTGLALVGLLLAMAASHVRDRAPAVAQTRRSLVAEVGERTAATDVLRRRVATLRGQVDAASQARLRASAAGAQTAARLQRLAMLTGSVPVEGPGVRVVLNDAADTSAPRAGRVPTGVEQGRILDYDLQRLVNGLWAAGAEAVAVDGQRLTALSAIRAAGDAILVDYRPLRPPYTVTAVGDPSRLEVAFVEDPVGSYFRTLKEAYGIRFDVSAVEDDMRLPAASATSLRYARVARPSAGVGR